MSEASTVETQSNASPARQMLAALTQASKEMTTRFNEVSERAAKLNAVLENDVNKSLTELNQQAESMVRVHLDSLTADKDAVLAELTVLRQEEMKVLQNIAKNLRDALTEKLNELVNSLRSDVKEQLSTFQLNIRQKETEVAQTEKNLRKVLREKLPLLLDSVQEKVNSEKRDLENLQFSHQGTLAQESKVLMEKLRDHGTELKGTLSKAQSEYMESLEQAVRELLHVQSTNLDKRIKDFADMHERAKPLLQVDMEFLEKLPPNFSESCSRLADMHVQMHSTAVKNLAMMYRSEISSIARETEDNLVVVRSQIQTQLRSYHDGYVEQAMALLAKFEQSVKDAKPAPAESATEPEEEAIPVEMFEKLRKEVRKLTKELISSAENEMEQGFTDFRSRLNSGNQAACSLVESSFHDCRKKIVELSEAHREELEELSHKGDALEQLVDEAKELIGALNPENLEF